MGSTWVVMFQSSTLRTSQPLNQIDSLSVASVLSTSDWKKQEISVQTDCGVVWTVVWILQCTQRPLHLILWHSVSGWFWLTGAGVRGSRIQTVAGQMHSPCNTLELESGTVLF